MIDYARSLSVVPAVDHIAGYGSGSNDPVPTVRQSVHSASDDGSGDRCRPTARADDAAATTDRALSAAGIDRRFTITGDQIGQRKFVYLHAT